MSAPRRDGRDVLERFTFRDAVAIVQQDQPAPVQVFDALPYGPTHFLMPIGIDVEAIGRHAFAESEAAFCVRLRALDVEYGTDKTSPLHHDNRCLHCKVGV